MFPIQCASCKNYIDDLKCNAYKNKIPEEIYTGKHDHKKPFPGDNGVRFELKDDSQA